MRKRLAMTPTAYAAKMTVTTHVGKPSRAWYSEYSGVGMVENAITARKAAAMTQKPAPWRRRKRAGMVSSVLVMIR